MAMDLSKIKVNNTIYECFYVTYTDKFFAQIKSEDYDSVKENFTNLTGAIIVMDGLGQVTARYTDYSNSPKFGEQANYYADDDGVFHSIITVELPKMDTSSKLKALESEVYGIVDEASLTLSQYKEYKIKKSKTMLEEYLLANPITSTAHNNTEGTYSITKEKQDLMTQNYLQYQIEKATNPDTAKLTWNETGKECEEWAEAEFIQLIIEIKNRVRPLVSYQQSIEAQINACISISLLRDIVIDYSSVETTSNTDTTDITDTTETTDIVE